MAFRTTSGLKSACTAAGGRTLFSSETFAFYLLRIVWINRLFCSLAVPDPRVSYTMDELSPFISVLCHSDWLSHWESCPRLDVVHSGRATNRATDATIIDYLFQLIASIRASLAESACQRTSGPVRNSSSTMQLRSAFCKTLRRPTGVARCQQSAPSPLTSPFSSPSPAALSPSVSSPGTRLVYVWQPRGSSSETRRDRLRRHCSAVHSPTTIFRRLSTSRRRRRRRRAADDMLWESFVRGRRQAERESPPETASLSSRSPAGVRNRRIFHSA